MGNHSAFPPSSMSRLIACPASWSRSKGTEVKESDVMREGTLAHAVLENILHGERKPSEWKDLPYGFSGSDISLEMIQAVMIAVNYINYIKSLWPGKEAIEETVDLSFWGLPDVWGTADYVYRCLYNNLYIVDYKHGQGVWVPADTAQLKTYAAGAAGEDLFRYEKIVLVIVQPRYHSDPVKIRTHEMTPQELYQWVTRTLVPALNNATSDNPDLNPGLDQCKWCPAAAGCRELGEHSLAIAQLDFESLPDTGGIPTPVSPEELASVYKHLPILEAWIRNVKAKVYKNLEKGNSVEGFKLVKGRNSRTWKDQEALIQALEEAGYDESTYMCSPVLKTPNMLEQALGKEKRILKKHIQVNKGKPIIAEESDRRQAITDNSAIEDFT